MEEYQVVNYTDENSFESFCKKNKDKILKKLKGKKMKTRLLRNARKLLDESTELPAPEKNEILLNAIEDTVAESESEGFEGEEFDHFRFAKKLRQKAEKKMNRPIPKLSIKNIFRKKKTLQALGSPSSKSNPAVIAQNGQLTSPAAQNLALRKAVDNSTTIAETKEQVPPSEETSAQETKANTIVSNGQLAFPKESADTQGTSENKDESVQSDEAGSGEEIKSDAGEAGKEEKKTTETKPEEKKNPETGINKKWIWGGGILIILIIILIIALKK